MPNMITLHSIYPALNWQSIANITFNSLCADSRKIQQHQGFILLKSHTVTASTSLTYAQTASQTARFIISEIAFSPAQIKTLACPYVYIANLRDHLGSLAQAVLQAKQRYTLPQVVAVTGTNGKTTISQLIAQLTHLAGQKTAVLGTAGNGILPKLTPASHTTSDTLTLQAFIYSMAKQAVQVLALEASSHGLEQQRLQGTSVKVAVFTNLSRDHLDYHQTMTKYAEAKAKLFGFTSLTHAIINSDDEYAQLMLTTVAQQNLARKNNRQAPLILWRYSLQDSTAEFYVKHMNPSLTGVNLVVATPVGELNLFSPLLGRFNVANLLAAIASLLALNLHTDTGQPINTHLPQLVKQLTGATGRMQRIASQQGCFIIDYAHTPDALTQVLTSLKPHCTGKLWAVFGCGGDRDTGKRPLMTAAALAVADKLILTADNPRTEEPQAILADMLVGIANQQQIKIEPDRAKAIALAVANATADDIVVIAGKGHETYQEINGVRYDFDDAQVLRQALKSQ